MLSLEEIRRFEAFADLEPPDYGRIARVAGDITLNAGEYVAHKGSEAALFGVLDGRIEVVGDFDGEIRVIGQRRPSDVFGEISITMAMRQPASYRAAEPTRVFRIDADDYHALSANAPAIDEWVRAKAYYRVGGASGLQAIVSAAAKSRAIVLGHRQDPACVELRQFLDRNQVRFQWLQP